MIKRRLVGGILSLLISFWELFAFYGYAQWAMGDKVIKNMEAYNHDGALATSYFVYGLLALIVGIVYVSTCKKQPIKWVEWTLAGITLFVYAFIFISIPKAGSEGSLFTFTTILQLAFYAIGAPTTKGYKNFPFAKKDDNDESTIEKLGKLKGLLDSGAITQEEFDKEKKKIWK